MLKISIHREGEFAVGWTHSHDHQCGNVGTNIVHYAVRIEGDDQHLSRDGYLCDNNAIPALFAHYQHVKDFQSCEHIARMAVLTLKARIGRDPEYATRVDRIVVEVTAIEHSGIAAEWQREDA